MFIASEILIARKPHGSAFTFEYEIRRGLVDTFLQYVSEVLIGLFQDLPKPVCFASIKTLVCVKFAGVSSEISMT